jgi:hypothetical protein
MSHAQWKVGWPQAPFFNFAPIGDETANINSGDLAKSPSHSVGGL